MIDDIVTRVCGTGFTEGPETRGLRHGGDGETIFIPPFGLNLLDVLKDL